MEKNAQGLGRQWLTPNEAAALLMVSPVTVRAWAARGELPAETTAGGHRRFLRGELERFARLRGLRLLEPKPAPATAGLRVLVVDDDSVFADFLAELLRQHGAEVAIALDGFAAGRAVERWQPSVVLLDLKMPGLDGFDVCRALKASPNTRDIRVLALTGYPSPENVAAIVAAGAEACLAKPVDTLRLLSTLGLQDAAREHA